MRKIWVLIVLGVLFTGTAWAANFAVIDQQTGLNVYDGVDILAAGSVGTQLRVFNVVNTSGVEEQLTGCSLSGSTAFSLGQPPGPVDLGNGANVLLNVQLVTASAGTYEGTIQCTGGGNFTVELRWTVLNSVATLDLSANGVEIADPGSWTFPATPVGSLASQQFTVKNLGSPTLTVTSITASGAPFSVSPASLSIPGGASAIFVASFSPTAAVPVSGGVTVSSNDGTRNPFVVTLYGTGTGVAPPAIGIVDTASGGTVVSPGSTVSFGSVSAGMQVNHTFRITNSGSSALTLASPPVTVSGAGFSLVAAPPSPIAANGGTASFVVGFNSASSGSGTVTLASNGSPSPFTFNVSASVSGAPPPASYTVTGPNGAIPNNGSWNFGSVPVGQGGDLSLTLVNNSSSPLAVSINPSISGAGMGISYFSGATFPGYSQTHVASLHFAPTAQGPVSGTFTFVAGGVPYTLHLSGSGAAPVPLLVVRWNADNSVIANGGTYNFGTVAPGAVASEVFDVTNVGAASLTFNSLALANTSPTAGFSLIVIPTSPIAAGGLSAGRIRLLSSSVGSYAATVSFATNDPLSPTFTFHVVGSVQAVAPTFSVLSGDGVAIVNGGTYAFGSSPVGTAVSRGFTLTNNGASAMTLADPSSFLAASGGFTIQQAFPAGSIAPGGTAACRIKFTPSALGAASGTVSIDGGAAGILTFTVTGSGS